MLVLIKLLRFSPLSCTIYFAALVAVASEAEEAAYRNSASKEMTRAERRRVNQDLAESRRKKWQQPSLDLEASWTSLDVFSKSHRGRISMEGKHIYRLLYS